MLFWTAAALLAGAIAALVMYQAARANRSGLGADPAEALYRRQLAELDELGARGVLNEEDRRSAFAEAARRLLSVSRPATSNPARRTPGGVVLGALALTALAAVGLYWRSGSPGLPDQPFAARLQSWQSAPLETLTASQVAAVLQSATRQRPDNVQLHIFLGQAQLAAGAPADAAIALRRAALLAPRDPAIQRLLGQALVAASQDQSVTPEAEAAFLKAASADPADLASRYFLGAAQIARGETAAGLRAWREIRENMPENDPRRAELDARIAEALSASAQNGAQAEMIAGMVNRLALRLRAQPDDPEGWARLVHAYNVLGKAEEQKQAMADARRALGKDPDALARFEGALGAN